jgi:hypothetical protein
MQHAATAHPGVELAELVLDVIVQARAHERTEFALRLFGGLQDFVFQLGSEKSVDQILRLKSVELANTALQPDEQRPAIFCAKGI